MNAHKSKPKRFAPAPQLFPTCKSCGVRVHPNMWTTPQPQCPVCAGPLRGKR